MTNFNLPSLTLQCALLGLSFAGQAYAQETNSDQSQTEGITSPGVTGEPEAIEETATGTVQLESEETITLPEITVTASPTTDVATHSTTGTKTDTPLIETPQSISVIGRDELEARGTQNLLEALRYTPGVAVNTFGHDIRGYEFLQLRGFDAISTSSYRDGLPQALFVNSAAVTEIYGVERVEVLRGPSSVLFGQGDAGGVVNRISKRPTGDAVREVEVQFGTFDRKQAAFDLGGQLGGDGALAYRLVGLGLDTDSQEEYPNGAEVTLERLYLAPSLLWQPSAATSLTILTEFIEEKAGDDVGFVTGPNGELTNVKEGDPRRSRIEQPQRSVGYQFEHHFDERWTARQNFRYADRNADKHHILSNLEADGLTLMRLARIDDDEVDQTTLDTQLHGKLRVGPTEHTLLFGIDWNRVKGEEQEFSDPAPSLDLLNPIYDQPFPEPTTLVGDFTQTTDQLGFYVQDQIKFDGRWVLTVGSRYDRVDIDTDNRFNATRTEQSDNVFSSRAGLTYLFGNGWAPYMSYAESFLPNLGVDANNRPLEPSRGEQYEVGLKFQPEGTRLLFTAALFDLRKTNVVTFDVITGDAEQTGEIRSRGVELEAKAELAKGLQATAAYTYLDVKVLESSNDPEIGEVPIQIPDQTASLWLDYTIRESAWRGLGFGGGVRYVGKRWNDAENTSAEPGYTVFDATIHYERGPWRVALNASNLFDKEYFASRAFGSFFRGLERTVVGSVEYWF